MSGDDRAKDGRNLKGQLELSRKYAQDQDWAVVAELAEDDRGASGASFELEQLNCAMEMARAGEFDVLVVRELDRLSRSLAKQLVVEEEFKQHGVKIEYVLGEYDDTPEGQLNKQIRAVIAEYEREKIVERMVRGRRNKVKAGKVLANGRAPYGYRISDDRDALVIHEIEARIVRLVFRWYVEGDDNQSMTISGITRKLSSMRINTFCDTGAYGCGRKKKARGEWPRSTVASMLKNETYAGVWHYGKVTVKNGKLTRNPKEHLLAVDVPAIVDRQLWEAAQRRLAENRKHARRPGKHKYLLNRRVTCGQCGYKMRGNVSGGTRLYYLCPGTVHIDATRPCNIPSFRTDQVDPVVWNWIRSLLGSRQMLTAGLEGCQAEGDKENAPLRDRLNAVNDVLANNQAELERLLDLYLAGDFPKEMLTERKHRLETTVGTLQRERDALTEQIRARMLTGEQIRNIQDFAALVAKGLSAAEESFEGRRGIIEALNVQVTLAIENDQKVVYVRCILGDDKLLLSNSIIAHAKQWGVD